MTEKRWLYFALGVTTVISIGAVTNQLVPLAPATGLALNDTGITFPDGTVQTTAAASEVQNVFQDANRVDIDPGYVGTGAALLEVPAGHRAIIETVSVQCQTPVGNSVGSAYLSLRAAGRQNLFNIPLRYHAQVGTQVWYIGGLAVRLYADHTEYVDVTSGAHRESSSGTTTCFFFVNGRHLPAA